MNLHSTSPLLAIGAMILFLGSAAWLVHELLDNIRTGRFINYIGASVVRDRTPVWFSVVMVAKVLVIVLFGYFAWLAFRALGTHGA